MTLRDRNRNQETELEGLRVVQGESLRHLSASAKSMNSLEREIDTSWIPIAKHVCLSS